LGDEPEINPWTVKEIKQEGGVSSYEVNAFDTKNQQGRLTVVFFKVNEETYCDILPARDSNANRYWSANMCPLHTLCKVEMAADTVRLLPLNKEWMEKNIKEKRIALSFLKRQQFVGHLINASTEEWKAFLEQYGKTAGVFTDERVFELKRVQEKPPAEGKPAEGKTAASKPADDSAPVAARTASQSRRAVSAPAADPGSSRRRRAPHGPLVAGSVARRLALGRCRLPGPWREGTGRNP
jgi:hypothetical protein